VSDEPLTLKSLAVDREAFETHQWVIDAILEVELMTPLVIDPCVGTGVMARAAAEAGHKVLAWDIVDWRQHLPVERIHWPTFEVGDFLAIQSLPRRIGHKDFTIFMNPPFSKAVDFVRHSLALGARKVVCFQRQAWRESSERKQFWEEAPPARVWVCGRRATCVRFDLLACSHEGGQPACPNFNRPTKQKLVGSGCSDCMNDSPTSNAIYVWERGHRGAEVTSAIYPRSHKPQEKTNG